MRQFPEAIANHSQSKKAGKTRDTIQRRKLRHRSKKNKNTRERISIELLPETKSIMTVADRDYAWKLMYEDEFQKKLIEDANWYRKTNRLGQFHLKHRIMDREEGIKHILYDRRLPQCFVLELKVPAEEAKNLLEKGCIADSIIRAVQKYNYYRSYFSDDPIWSEEIIQAKGANKGSAQESTSVNHSNTTEKIPFSTQVQNTMSPSP